MAKNLRLVQGKITEVEQPDLFVQQANPNMTKPGMWWELNGDGTLKTLWIETGIP